MPSRGHKLARALKMDPSCAVCSRPAQDACDCEAKGLERAVKESEDRVMKKIYQEIRQWVRQNARDHVLESFRQLSQRRKDEHQHYIDRITAQAWQHYRAPPHPQQLAEADEALKQGIDMDWATSVQRYPEVLEYYFGLVEFTIPDKNDPIVQKPNIGRRGGQQKMARRGGYAGPPAITASAYPAVSGYPPRTPPPPGYDRRPQREKRVRHSMPPQQHAPYTQMHHAPYMQ